MGFRLHAENKINWQGDICDNLIELCEHRIRIAKDRPVFTYTDHRQGIRTLVMPGQFWDDCQAVGAWLRVRHREREHIAVMGDNSYPYILAMFGIICSNLVAVPVDRALETKELLKKLAFADCAALFCSEKYRRKADEIREKLGIPVYNLEDQSRILAEGGSLKKEGRSGFDPENINENDPALMLFTSGTTGDLKCVMVSQKSMCLSACAMVRQTGMHYTTVVFLPLHHIFSWTYNILGQMWSGYTAHINLDLRDLLRDIRAENPEKLSGVPSFIELFHDQIWQNIRNKGIEEEVQKKLEDNRTRPELTMEEKRCMFREALDVLGSDLQVIFSGGAPVGRRLYDGFREFGIEMGQGYGATESSLISATCPGDDREFGHAGKVVPGCEIKIDQPDEHGQGEICARGSGIMLGYYKDEEATRRVIRDGWFHTGDKGRIDEDGYLYVTGRIKNLIILSNGENVSPEEIEDRLSDHPGIREIVVYEKNDRIAAGIFPDEEYWLMMPDKDFKEEIDRFIDSYNASVAAFKEISIVEYRDTPFEKTTTGKIKRI